jgi:hypothetical protein
MVDDTSEATYSLLINSITLSFYLILPKRFSIGENSGVVDGIYRAVILSYFFTISLTNKHLCDAKLSITTIIYFPGYLTIIFLANASKY